MLMRFSVENYLSFKEKQTLDLTVVPSCKERLEENTFQQGSESLLKSLVIYGANASGKSNLCHAINFFRFFIMNSSKDTQSEEKISVIPFLLNPDMASRPSCFEIEFLLNTKHYRYGFQVNQVAVVKEWLFIQDKPIFMRATDKETDVIQIVNGWEKAKGLEERTRHNALFLSVCAQFAMPDAEEIMTWFSGKFHSISGVHDSRFKGYTMQKIQDGQYRDAIIAFLKNADMSIAGLFVKEKDLSETGSTIPAEKKRMINMIHTQHNIYDDNANVVGLKEFSLEGLESLGTQKAFALAGPIVDTLKTGAILVVDELDSRLHPIFTRQIVKMFNSVESNPLHAQLIFNTHDTNLLSYRVHNSSTKAEEYLFRRDQIYFAEKDHVEATHLYSLIEFKKKSDCKKIRNDASFEKDYLNGIYGAIPYIGNLLNTPGSQNE